MKAITLSLAFILLSACAPLALNYTGEDYGYVATAIVASNDSAEGSSFRIKLKDTINDWDYMFGRTFAMPERDPVDIYDRHVQIQIYARRMKVSEYSATSWEADLSKDGKNFKAKGNLMKPFKFEVKQGEVTYLDPVVFAKVKLQNGNEYIAGMHYDITPKIKELAQKEINKLEQERIANLK